MSLGSLHHELPESISIGHVYATYFDGGYLARGLALFHSLREHGDDAEIWVLCLDAQVESFFDELGDARIHTITVDDLEVAEPRLLEVKGGRSRMEYYFTCSPLMLRYVMAQQTDPEMVVIYLDSDLYFFDDPAIALSALGDGSIGIIEHRYPPRLAKRLRKYGRFNVGWVALRADADGRACLDWWATSCLDWCFDTPDAGRYADQGYLDWFPERFRGVVVLDGTGLNLAPWNTGRHSLSVQATNGSGRVIVDGTDALVFFHFHGIKRRGRWFVTSQLVYGSSMSRILRDRVYSPYTDELDRFTLVAARHAPVQTVSKRGKGWRGRLFSVQRMILDGLSIATGNALRVAANPDRTPPA